MGMTHPFPNRIARSCFSMQNIAISLDKQKMFFYILPAVKKEVFIKITLLRKGEL
jgi:hypothetical protein